MTKALLVAAALVACGSTAVLADPPGRWEYRRPYDWCEAKARRLHEFEHRAARDGIITPQERRIMHMLREDLQESCGGGRWHPDRGWHRG